jgi:pimeloyl-ACP methyl ester carboxylesterase
MTAAPNTSVITTSAILDGAPTWVFIHGFLDDATVWDGVIASLAGKVNTVRYDLPGFGARSGAVADPKELSLQTLAAEAGEVFDDTDGRVVVVGQSLGTQIAELVAAQHADRVDGLVLLTPVPLGGTRLADAALAPFRALGGDLDAQRSARSQLSPALAAAQLDRLIKVGAAASPEVVTRYVDIWNNGVSDAPATSAYQGPVLVIRGGIDGFVTKALVEVIVPRFPGAHEEVIEHGGHWLHVEQPDAAAQMLAEFSDDITNARTASGWRGGFADKSQDAFAAEFTDNVVLDATTLATPVKGKQDVARVLATASSIYESLEFTAEAHDGPTTYLQWKATAFGGVQIRGITILDRDASGKIVAAAIHHRPLGAVLRFAAEIRNRLTGVISADDFLQETP